MTAVLPSRDLKPGSHVAPDDVREVLSRSILADGLDFVLDVDRSAGSHLVDARTGERYLDMFTFFASSALGMNHPALADDQAFRAELAAAALNKPSNSDVYSVPMARFVETFARVLGDPALPHLFFVDGGALAVENALKVAFDWKSRFNESRGIDPALGTKVLHLQGAFHGRSGYTLSLTNTDPNKVARFPKFDWPRIDAPYLRSGANMAEAEAESLRQARAAFEASPHDIACFIAEPIQGEGGDRHFRGEFFAAMRALCDEFDALMIFDEVQTGCGITGTAWAYQQLGVMPDVVAFGKKTQVGRRRGRQRVCRQFADQLHVGRQSDGHGQSAAHPGDDRRRAPAPAGSRPRSSPARSPAGSGRRVPRTRRRAARPWLDVRVQHADGGAAGLADRQAVGSSRDHAGQWSGQRPLPACANRVAG
jgi:L-lysine 6-transaminase